MIKILIADDHALMREGIKQLLALASEVVVVAEAANGADVLSTLRQTKIDLILLDMSMSGISGATLIKHIASQSAHPPILVLSMHTDLHVVRYALQAGAAGYLTKDCHPKVLLDAVRKVAAGGHFMDPALAESMAFDRERLSGQFAHERLSAREFAIFGLLAAGRTVNEVADVLAISNKTVSTHKARLMEKLNCRTNAELIRYALTHRLVQ